MRVKILALFEQDDTRSLAAKDLLPNLAAERTSSSAVAYHVRLLQDAELLPASD